MEPDLRTESGVNGARTGLIFPEKRTSQDGILAMGGHSLKCPSGLKPPPDPTPKTGLLFILTLLLPIGHEIGP
jgi:hypothetical protein